jgi:threonine dehydrogenase-like Zn-dependent dehydrogenase
VLILGGGPIGLAILLCLNAQGVSKVFLSEISPARKALASELGATQVLDPSQEDVAATCRKAFDNEGAHVVFDCAGVRSMNPIHHICTDRSIQQVQASIDTALQSTRARATIVNVAVWEKNPIIRMNALTFKEKVYKGCAAPEHQDFVSVMKALEDGRLKPLPLATKRIKLSEVEKEGFQTLLHDKSHAKILVQVSGG